MCRPGKLTCLSILIGKLYICKTCQQEMHIKINIAKRRVLYFFLTKLIIYLHLESFRFFSDKQRKMDCMCDVVFSIGKNGCLVWSFLLGHIHHIGIFVLFANCLIITLIRVLELDENYGKHKFYNLL